METFIKAYEIINDMDGHEVAIGGVRYLDPTTEDYNNYHDHILAFNRRLVEASKRSLADFFDKDSYLALMTTGSDARFEKGSGSPLEIIMCVVDDYNGDMARRRVASFLEQDEREDQYESIDDMETKVLGKDKASKTIIRRGTKQEASFTSPNRVFDAYFLAGSHDLYGMLKQKLIREIQSPIGGDMLKDTREKVAQHKRFSSTGVQKYKGDGFQFYDVENGNLMYNPEKGLYSFKQGPIRLIQYAITRDYIKSIRENPLTADRLLDLSTNTVSKLNDLEVEGMLAINPSQRLEITDCYKFFLWAYHVSQALHRQGTTLIHLDPKEVKDRIEAVSAICSERIIV